ncbi:hypothetical protein Poli38472_007724 [Pythium oligandrum]|uniref:Major facilitator superfamily (MFS) profile domain-containing protein n=1 Tax=Pythium oligandrum TaxID=41045 RepID=A0A8K1CSP9_PYTOL|nr:hypothetical protein Poli38472_007724 [Pythium oligandrum]|eukprot:TMW68052.1 hypothetical protein Poli38472_007724 [Pythium oligandrum]
MTQATPEPDPTRSPSAEQATLYQVVVQTPEPINNGEGRDSQRPRYPIRVDPLQEDRAVEIKLLNCARPHMRAFHFAWVSFFIAFFGWFSIPPLMPTIKKQLKLNADQVANANIASVASTIAGRIIIGPLCDQYGPRVIQAVLLIVGAVPVACAGLASNYTGFVVVRFFIGLVGCSFVATSYWTSIIFSKEVVGSANALAAGWGNLGAGVTYLVTPFLFDLVTWDNHVSDDLGWRLTLLFPAVFMVIIGACLYKFSDDSPRGNFSDLRKMAKRGSTESELTLKPSSVNLRVALLQVSRLPVTWILAFQYACSFGVELQVHNVLSLFYYEDFTRSGCDANADAMKCRILTQTTAGLISSLFGLMCLFARALGGYLSDVASRWYGMKGRIVVQSVAFAGQAVTLYVYSQVRSISGSIPCLILFGVFVQACTGTTFAIVPYVSTRYTGATSGIVGAGGNVGALCWGFLFKGVGSRSKSFEYLSAFVGASALMCFCTTVNGEGSMWARVSRAQRNSDYGATRRLMRPETQPRTPDVRVQRESL